MRYSWLTIKHIFLAFIIAGFVLILVVPTQYLPVNMAYDKLFHCLAFFLLQLVMVTIFSKPLWISAGFVAGFSALMEWVQSWLPYRSANWEDLEANLIGVILASLLYLMIKLKLKTSTNEH